MSDAASPSDETEHEESRQLDGSDLEVADQPLRLTTVTYDDSPDRATIHPPNRTGYDRMETWLSVDVSVLVDRSAWR
jgi:hypothetical protein